MTAPLARRKFLAALGAATAWPLAARPQPQVPTIGFLSFGFGRDISSQRPDVFRQALSENGYVEGRTVVFDVRNTDGRFDRLPVFAAELVQRKSSVIVASGPPSVRAAMAATSTIPIVFGIGEDPIKEGLVESLSRPGRNVTGYTDFSNVLVPKRIELLREIVSKQAVLDFLINPDNPNAEPDTMEAQMAAQRFGLVLEVLKASTEGDLDAAFTTTSQRRLGALLVGVDPFFRDRRALIVALAARHAVPAMYERRYFATAGGLMSYSTSDVESARQSATFVSRILKGAKPADLPVVQASKFQFVINLNAAKALGLAIPADVLSIADEVIE